MSTAPILRQGWHCLFSRVKSHPRIRKKPRIIPKSSQIKSQNYLIKKTEIYLKLGEAMRDFGLKSRSIHWYFKQLGAAMLCYIATYKWTCWKLDHVTKTGKQIPKVDGITARYWDPNWMTMFLHVKVQKLLFTLNPIQFSSSNWSIQPLSCEC